MIRPEPYHREHERSQRGMDRRRKPETVDGLLRWAHGRYVEETPAFEYALTRLAEDGDPEMVYPVRAYLALSEPSNRLSWEKREQEWQRPDVWCRIAGTTDEDGMYRTPLRRAIESIDDPSRRKLLRDLVPELFLPGDIAAINGVPGWCAGDVLFRSLSMLWDRYRERPERRPGYLDRSDAQRSAEVVAAA